jgi:rhamnose utilization protein RhaD (predicted bifunctional aldolase and dehydrogenase)
VTEISNLNSLNFLTALVGSDLALVQGAGGNISLKNGDRLIVKASGTWMSRALASDIFTEVSRSEVIRRIENGEPDWESGSDGLRPSIETALHALTPQTLVLHVHMLGAIILAALPGATKSLTRKLSGLNWATLPYYRPGRPLALAIGQLLAASSAPPNVIMLENHGLLLGADSAEDLINLLNECVRKLDLPPRPILQPRPRLLTAIDDLGWVIPSEALFHALALDSVASLVAEGPPLQPDQVVFLGPRTLILEPGARLSKSVDDFTARHGFRPKVAILPGAGVLVAPGISAGAMAALGALARSGLRVPVGSPPLNGLTAEQCRELARLEAEKHRLSVDAAELGAGR